MYRKQIAYLMMVGIKFFFNLDHDITNQLFIVGILVLSSTRYMIAEGMNSFNRFCRNIFITIVHYIAQFKNGNEKIALHFRPFRNYLQKDISRWSLNAK
jgi:hypothetical protein